MFTINQSLIDDFADKINEKEKKNNKVSSWSNNPNHNHYPTEKLVKDSLDNVLKNFRTKTITSTFSIIQTREYEDNGVTHTSTMYDGGGGHWELTINLTSLNNGKLALWNPEHGGQMEIIVDNGTLAIADPNGNIYLDGDTLPDDREFTATGTSGSDMPVTIPYENVVINFKNNGEDILITFSQNNTTIYSMTLHQNENWKYNVVRVMTIDNPNYTITGVSEYDIPNYYTETNYTFTNPERYEDNDVIIPIYDFSIVEYTVDFTYDDVDWNNNEVSWLRFGKSRDHNQIYVINNKIYWINQDPPSSIQSDEEWVEWIELNCPMLCQGTQITFKRYFLDGCVMTEWNDSNIAVTSDDWYSYITYYNEPVPASFNSYDGIDSVNVTVQRFKKALPTLVSDFKDANQYEKISNKSSSITTDTGSTSKYPTVKAIEDYAQHLLNTVTLSTNKQEMDAGENFIITANVKDNNGNPISGESLQLIKQAQSYTNDDIWNTCYAGGESKSYLNDSTLYGDWTCSFSVQNTSASSGGILIKTSTEEHISFTTLGHSSFSYITITCADNTITINKDGTDYSTTYTQTANGTQVGIYALEDQSVNIKNVLIEGEMKQIVGTETTDNNGSCSWNFEYGLEKGLYSFYVDNSNIDVFVGLFDENNLLYKTIKNISASVISSERSKSFSVYNNPSSPSTFLISTLRKASCSDITNMDGGDCAELTFTCDIRSNDILIFGDLALCNLQSLITIAQVEYDNMGNITGKLFPLYAENYNTGTDDFAYLKMTIQKRFDGNNIYKFIYNNQSYETNWNSSDYKIYYSQYSLGGVIKRPNFSLKLSSYFTMDNVRPFPYCDIDLGSYTAKNFNRGIVYYYDATIMANFTLSDSPVQGKNFLLFNETDFNNGSSDCFQQKLVVFDTQSTEIYVRSYSQVSGVGGNWVKLATTSDLNSKQDTLVSGTNLKTINNESLLGSGNISITGGGGTVDSSWVTNSTNPVQSQLIKSALDSKSDTSHTHSQYLTEHQSLANYVTTSDSRLTDARTPTAHTHTTTDITNLSIPTASSTTPSADTESGSVGTGTTWARSNHTHPKSSLYAEASHTHSNYVNPTIADNLTTNDSSQVLSAKQGKVLNDLIGQAITYINQ